MYSDLGAGLSFTVVMALHASFGHNGHFGQIGQAGFVQQGRDGWVLSEVTLDLV
jgi:hypothetical protein